MNCRKTTAGKPDLTGKPKENERLRGVTCNVKQRNNDG